MNKLSIFRKKENNFKELQRNILFRTIMIFIAACMGLILVYDNFIYGRFATTVVGFLNRYIYKDYETALNFYYQYIGRYIEWYTFAAIVFIFLVSIRFYLKGFTRYFDEINKGIDILSEDNLTEISLGPELAVIEKKLNSVKNSFKQQKLATEVAEKRKNDLVVYLAHDLKTPLTSVIGYLTLLRDEVEISDELREKYMSITLDKAERLEDLINEFFEITRFNLSNITLEYSKVNLTRLLEQLTYEFKPMFMDKNLQCEIDMDTDVMIKCDVDKIQRVFDNLLRNAVKYSFKDSIIRIVVNNDEDRLIIRFINNGNTIPQEKLERIFEQFFRLDSARNSRTGGAGVGLAIAKEIVELHNGEIIAKSENEVIEFEVRIPIG